MKKMDQHRLTLTRLSCPRLYTNLVNNGAHIIELLLSFSNFINQSTTGCLGIDLIQLILFHVYSRPPRCLLQFYIITFGAITV